jgi:signal transduction histidine kinase/CHASE3 domain sensor protein
MEKIRHLRIKLIFIFASMVLLSLSIFSYLRINNLMKSGIEVSHTHMVKLELETLFSEIKDAESSHRGYMLTNHNIFLNHFNTSVINVGNGLQRLGALARDNYSQRENTKILKALINKRIDYMQMLLRKAGTEKISSKEWLIGRTLMDDVRHQVDKMMDEEDFLLRLRTKSFTKESSLTPLFTIFLMICSIMVLIISYYGINLELKISNALRDDLEIHKKNLLAANDSLQKSNQEIALSRYNKRFLTEFSEKFSNYKVYNEFFNSVVQYIADMTHLDCVLVGRIDSEKETERQVHTIAVTAFGKLTANFTYPLIDGPSLDVIMGEDYSFPKKVTPRNKTLEQLSGKGYMGYPLFDSDGTAIGIIAVMHEQPIEDPETLESILKIVAKRAEMELQRTKNEELLARKNAALQEKNESLAKMNKELESFTYISSHDLQEPLRKIQTFITRIIDVESERVSEAGRNYLHRTQESAKRMQNLIRDLLAYSRLNAEIFPTEQANLYTIIEEVKTDLDEEIKDKNVTIEVKGDAHVKIIESQFHQLLTNLISNSIKFVARDVAPRITIENKQVKGNKVPFEHSNPKYTYSKITVSDNGIGFENEYRNRIFEVFQRLHTIKDYPGTGIGLAIVKKIVDNHHGFISADSRLGKGAVFTIYLPA